MRLSLTIALLVVLVNVAAAAHAATTQPRKLAEKDAVGFAVGQQRIVVYKFENVPFKPYISRLCTPSGVNVLLDSPPDHKHHHGVMFAIGANGVDFWAETPDCGKQVPLMLNFDDLSFGHRSLWKNAKGESILGEDRSITLHPTEGVTLITWSTTIAPANRGETVRLTGSHYFGLGMRFIRSMDKNGTWITPGGKLGDVVRGDERLTPGKWCAYTAKADGKDVTVAMFDGPKNVRPALWFTMADPFAYISATINLWKQPLDLKEATTFTYGIAAWDGTKSAEQIEAAYEWWLK